MPDLNQTCSRYTCDQHTHTIFSFDGHDSPAKLCESAIAAGLCELCITDHYDIDGIRDGFYADYDAQTAYAEISHCAETYSGRLKITYGIELGQPNHCPEQAREFLASHPFDYVIGSIHNLRDMPDFCFMNYEKMPQTLIDSLFYRSLAELKEVAGFDGISTLAHITYPHRYIKRYGRDIDFSTYTGDLRELFRILIERGVALEFNISTLIPAGFTMPDIEIMKLYRECGGEMVTVGTDSHYAEKVGMSIPEAYGMLCDAGFRYITVFRDRKPEMIKIS